MVTSKYEAAMIFSVKEGDEAVAALNEKFQALIAENATVENVDDWGKRKLILSTTKTTVTMFSQPLLLLRSSRQSLSV